MFRLKNCIGTERYILGKFAVDVGGIKKYFVDNALETFFGTFNLLFSFKKNL